MSSKKRNPCRRGGSGVRKHATQRLMTYVGNKKGFSNNVAKRILWACRTVAKKERVSEVPINKETLEKSGCRDKYIKYLETYKIKKGLRAMFAPDGSLTNIFQEE